MTTIDFSQYYILKLLLLSPQIWSESNFKKVQRDVRKYNHQGLTV